MHVHDLLTSPEQVYAGKAFFPQLLMTFPSPGLHPEEHAPSWA
jgi:hypothetical protein